MKRLFVYFFLAWGAVSFSACSNDAEKQAEFAKIVESRSVVDLLNDLYIGSDGDIEALARVLNATPSSIERLRKEETAPTEKFIERVREVSIYYVQEGQSFRKLRSALDPQYKWYSPMWEWICSPSVMEDKYVDTINPVIEQLH